MAEKKKIVFLCTGNVCRSPMGEAMLKHAIDALPNDDPLKSFEVVSAGTSTIDGMKPSDNSIEAMRRVGIDISKYRSSKLTQKMIDEAFAIFAMEDGHLETLKSQFINPPKRILTVQELNPDARSADVPDPYGGDLNEYLDVRDDIVQAMPHIVKYLQNELKNS